MVHCFEPSLCVNMITAVLAIKDAKDCYVRLSLMIKNVQFKTLEPHVLTHQFVYNLS